MINEAPTYGNVFTKSTKRRKNTKKLECTMIPVARHTYLCLTHKHQQDGDKAKIVVWGGEIVGNFAFFPPSSFNCLF